MDFESIRNEKSTEGEESIENNEALPSQTHRHLESLMKNKDMAERMAYAVDNLRELSISLHEEAAEKLKTLGYESVPTREEIIGPEYFNLVNQFKVVTESGYNTEVAEAVHLLYRARRYETSAQIRENEIAWAADLIEKYPESAGLYEKGTIISNIIGAHFEGRVGKMRETAVGRVTAAAKEGAEDMTETIVDKADHGADFVLDKAEKVGRKIEDLGQDIRYAVDDIKWKI